MDGVACHTVLPPSGFSLKWSTVGAFRDIELKKIRQLIFDNQVIHELLITRKRYPKRSSTSLLENYEIVVVELVPFRCEKHFRNFL